MPAGVSEVRPGLKPHPSLWAQKWQAHQGLKVGGNLPFQSISDEPRDSSPPLGWPPHLSRRRAQSFSQMEGGLHGERPQLDPRDTG